MAPPPVPVPVLGWRLVVLLLVFLFAEGLRIEGDFEDGADEIEEEREAEAVAWASGYDDDDDDDDDETSSADAVQGAAVHPRPLDAGLWWDEASNKQLPGAHSPPPELLHLLGIAEMAIGITLLIAFAVTWVRGQAVNNQVALSFAANVIDLLQEQFEYVGFEEPHGRTEVPQGGMSGLPCLARDGASCFKLYATGRRRVRGCLMTLQLRRRHNLLALLCGTAGGDRVAVEYVLEEGGQTPFVAGYGCPDAPEIVERVSSQCGRPGVSFTRGGVATDCEEALGKVFTAPALDTAVYLAEQGYLLEFLSSDSFIPLADNAFRRTDAYAAEEKCRRQGARCPDDLRDTCSGLRFVFRLPAAGDPCYRVALLLCQQLSLLLADQAASSHLPPQVHARQVARRDQRLVSEFAKLQEERNSAATAAAR